MCRYDYVEIRSLPNISEYKESTYYHFAYATSEKYVLGICSLKEIDYLRKSNQRK